MAGTFTTQSHTDFHNRVRRVAPAHGKWGRAGTQVDTTTPRPFGSVLLGFGWTYLVISVASNRATIESSLGKGSLPEQYHGYIYMTLAALLAASLVMLALHVVRFFVKRGAKRSNSGGMLIGLLGALTLIYTPANVWNTGFDMLDGNSRTLLLTASATVTDALPGVDLSGITLVSSQGR